MAEVMRPDGTTIHYEVFGEDNGGTPLLLFAPGGVNSQIEFWQRSIINPIDAFADEFMVIGMDQRHCGQSRTALEPFSYDKAMLDQVAVLDAVGVQRAHLMGGCIGCAYALRMADQAPARVAGVIMQDPVGLDETNSPETFYDMFNPTIRLCRAEGLEAVIAEAERDPIFMQNNAAGPFAQRIHDEPLFADAVRITPPRVLHRPRRRVPRRHVAHRLPLLRRQRGRRRTHLLAHARHPRRRPLPPHRHRTPHLQRGAQRPLPRRRRPCTRETARHTRRHPPVHA